MQTEIPVFFTIDNSYVPYLSVALASAIDHADPARRFRAIILHEDVSAENQDLIRALATEHFAVEFLPMQKGLESITDCMSNRLRCDYFTLTIYYRLFIPEMFPQYDKGIYIDSDVVIPGDLAELFDTDIGDNYIGACADLSVADVPPLVQYMEQAVGVPGNTYINSGVLLMNMKKLRQAHLDTHFLTLLNTYHFDCIAPDQDYLNAMCHTKIHYLPAEWDTMPNDNHPAAAHPKLIHYNLFAKPWCYDNIQYEEYFWEYAKKSAFYRQISDGKSNYSDEQKASDAKCLELLCERGAQIAQSEGTFRKIFEKGEKIRL